LNRLEDVEYIFMKKLGDWNDKYTKEERKLTKDANIKKMYQMIWYLSCPPKPRVGSSSYQSFDPRIN
jgi:hypothetical protein